MARYRLKTDVATYKAGQVVELNARQAERLAGYVELVDRDQPVEVATLPPDGYARHVADLKDQLSQAAAKIKSQAARIVELEQLVADYSASQATPTPVETPAVETSIEEAPIDEPAVEEVEAPEVVAPAEPIEEPAVETPAPAEPEPVEEAVEEPVEEPAPVETAPEPAGDDAKWRAKPTGSLNIPGSLKGRLLSAGLKTAGEVWDGLHDGRVDAISGIGEAKAADLRAHLVGLAE